MQCCICYLFMVINGELISRTLIKSFFKSFDENSDKRNVLEGDVEYSKNLHKLKLRSAIFKGKMFLGYFERNTLKRNLT